MGVCWDTVTGEQAILGFKTAGAKVILCFAYKNILKINTKS